MLYNKIVIIGNGLMGASLANLLEEQQIAREIKAFSRSDADYYILKDADIIFIAVPLSQYQYVFENIAKVRLLDNVIISDLGSVKYFTEELAKKYLPNISFVASHPIAGSHLSGTGTIIRDLYLNKKILITGGARDDMEKISAIWRNCGSITEMLPAVKHDHIYAYVSHLVQKLAFNLDYLFDESLEMLNKKINSANFTKFIRLNSSNLALWEDIFHFNANFIEEAMINFKVALQQYIYAIEIDIDKHDKASSVDNDHKIYLDLAIIIAALTKRVIKENIKDYQNYIGQGYIDFTAIADNNDYYAIKNISQRDYVKDRLTRFLNNL
jgi:prephenate dehydrogenase